MTATLGILAVAGDDTLGLPRYISSSNWNETASSSATDLQWQHTVTADTTCLVICAGWTDSASPTTANNAYFNGVSLTRYNTVVYSSNSQTQIFYLLNPPKGTFTARSLYAGSIDRLSAAMAINLGGVKEVLTSGGNSLGSGGTRSVTLSLSKPGVIVGAPWGYNSGTGVPTLTMPAPPNSIQAQTSSNSSSGYGKRITVFYTPLQPAGSVVCSVNFGIGDNTILNFAAFG